MDQTSVASPAGAPTFGIRALYNHSTDRNPRNAKWSEFQDLILEEKHLKERGMAYPIIQRFSKAETPEGEVSWATHSIEIQSPRLKAIFDKVFTGYPEWYPDAAPYTFFPPFKPLVHRWEVILQAFAEAEAEADSDTTATAGGDGSGSGKQQLIKEEIAHLRQVIEPLLSNHLSAMNKARETLVVSFESLWLFLAPGSIMLSSEQGSPCALRLLRVDFTPHDTYNNQPGYWSLTLGQYDWNGSYCGLRRVDKTIMEYKEDTLVTKHEVFPLEYAPGREKIEQELLARGVKWAALRGMHVKNVTGKKYVWVNIGGCMREIAKPVS